MRNDGGREGRGREEKGGESKGGGRNKRDVGGGTEML